MGPMMVWSEALGIFVPMLAILGCCGYMGLKTWTNYKLKMREMLDGYNERLTEAVQQLHDEVGSMREEFAELQERMDFTERVLAEVKSRNVISPGDST